jgi:hypothetical protein
MFLANSYRSLWKPFARTMLLETWHDKGLIKARFVLIFFTKYSFQNFVSWNTDRGVDGLIQSQSDSRD